MLAMKKATKAAAMKAMKAAKQPMKKAMKAKRVSVIAKSKFAKALVLRGSKAKTLGGLTAQMLTKSTRGRVVSKKASAHGKKAYRNIQGWTRAVQQARKALGVTGFVAVNGKAKEGKAIYAKAKELFSIAAQA